jgi:hypothetical protein
MTSKKLQIDDIRPLPASIRAKIGDEQLALGLAYRCAGHSWRSAAKLAGYSNHVTLWMNGKSYMDLLEREERFDQLRNQVFDAASEALAQTQELLLDGEVSPTQVPIVAGIMVDKAERLERVQRPEAEAANPFLAALGKAITSGGSVTVSADVPKTIDVEAEKVDGD